MIKFKNNTMKSQSGKKLPLYYTLTCALVLMGAPPLTYGADAAQIQIKATVIAVCSLSAPASVALEDIPITAFSGKAPGEMLKDYSKTFIITTTCSGTEKYKLEFTTTGTINYNCLTASSSNLGFCLYGPGEEKIMLAGNKQLTGDTSKGESNITVIPMRLGTPTAGEHSVTMTITISPL